MALGRMSAQKQALCCAAETPPNPELLVTDDEPKNVQEKPTPTVINNSSTKNAIQETPKN